MRLWRTGWVLSLALLTAGFAQAQFGGRFGGFGGREESGPGRLLGLLQNRQVREELNIKSDEDVLKILKSGLSEKQFTRLKQIYYQMQGGFALKLQEVQDALNLSPAQRDDLKVLFGDYDKERQALQSMLEDLRKKGGFNREAFGQIRERSQRLATRRKEIAEKALSVLNSSQKKAWKDLLGDEFKFERPRGFGPGFGRPGGGRPGAGRPGRPGGDGQFRRPPQEGNRPSRPRIDT